MSYLLSIIIPTKNRYRYLKGCLDSLKSFDSNDVEIVVQDNSDDTTEFEDYMRENAMPNLKYYRQTGKLSQTDNSDLAVGKATGKYCCFIGDDDSLSSWTIQIVRIMEKEGVEACVCNVATYFWDDVVFEGASRPPLSFFRGTPNVKVLKSDKVIKRVMSFGLQDIARLARVYHGIVSKHLLDKVKSVCGSYFPGPSPDMANAISCTSSIDKYIYVNMPLIISGFSYKSAGGMGMRGAHKGSLKASDQLPANVEDGWDVRIPKAWLGYTIWPQSGLCAARAMGITNLPKMNYHAMYAKTYLRYPDYRSTVMQFCPTSQSKLKLWAECMRFAIRYGLEKARIMYRKYRGTIYSTSEHISLDEAKRIVDGTYNDTIITNLNIKK